MADQAGKKSVGTSVSAGCWVILVWYWYDAQAQSFIRFSLDKSSGTRWCRNVRFVRVVRCG